MGGADPVPRLDRHCSVPPRASTVTASVAGSPVTVSVRVADPSVAGMNDAGGVALSGDGVNTSGTAFNFWFNANNATNTIFVDKANASDPNQTATLESYDTLMAYGRYNGINLDIGHFTASNYDAVAFIKQHHDKITNLHLKDRKRDHGANVPWGQGDTPIKDVLLLLKQGTYGFPANIELEYPIPQDSTVAAEMKKCLAYCKGVLA